MPRANKECEAEVGPRLQLQDQVHPLLAQRVDVVEDEGDDDVDAVAFVGGDAVLRGHRGHRGTIRGTAMVVSSPLRYVQKTI